VADAALRRKIVKTYAKIKAMIGVVSHYAARRESWESIRYQSSPGGGINERQAEVETWSDNLRRNIPELETEIEDLLAHIRKYLDSLKVPMRSLPKLHPALFESLRRIENACRRVSGVMLTAPFCWRVNGSNSMSLPVVHTESGALANTILIRQRVRPRALVLELEVTLRPKQRANPLLTRPLILDGEIVALDEEESPGFNCFKNGRNVQPLQWSMSCLICFGTMGVT
jgi:hypothetical protein